MAKEFIGNAANLYMLPVQQGEGDQARQSLLPMAELILMTIEADYSLDAELRIVKSQKLDTGRVHISSPNLSKYIENLGHLREQMEQFKNKFQAQTVEEMSLAV